jgi:glycosyltransferase involved in cell wall biosynthesis
VQARRIRLLILCWGYSIHAERRARLFIDDPRFDVAVASTYDYAFPGARNVALTGAERSNHSRPAATQSSSRLVRSVRGAAKRLAQVLLLALELRTLLRDRATLLRVMDDFQPDVVLLQTLQYPSYLAYALPRSQRLMVTFWNGDLTYFARWTGVEMFAKKSLVVHGLKRVDAITVNSQTAFDAAVALGADAAKMYLIRYPGADLARFQPRSREEARRRLGITASRVVLCPRGLGDFFNSRSIVQAAALLEERHADTLFLFVSGVGAEEWKEHVALAARLGVRAALRYDGHIAWQDMPWYYSAADVMLSVKTADSCPNCMLEAMACGIPVVMSDTSQNREWIEPGKDGFLCEPRDVRCLSGALEALFGDARLARRFAEIQLQKVRRDANSEINIERIKDIVIRLAS